MTRASGFLSKYGFIFRRADAGVWEMDFRKGAGVREIKGPDLGAVYFYCGGCCWFLEFGGALCVGFVI